MKKIILMSFFLLVTSCSDIIKDFSITGDVDSDMKLSYFNMLGTPDLDYSEGMVEGADGNIYIIGHTKGNFDNRGNAGDHDILIMSFNSSGKKNWSKLIGTPATDIGKDIKIDSNGDLLIVGYSNGNLDEKENNGANDIFVAKLNSKTGDILWLELLGSDKDDYCESLVLDDLDNIYLTGNTRGNLPTTLNNGVSDIFLAKYTPAGSLEWIKLFGSNDEYGEDFGYDIDLDDNTNIYITGKTDNDLNEESPIGLGYDIFIIKTDLDGNLLATKIIGSEAHDGGVSLKVSNNKIYLTGYSGGIFNGILNGDHFGLSDIFIAELELDLSISWIEFIGTADDDASKSIEISGEDLYITGDSKGDLDLNSNSGEKDIFILKYSTSGEKIWSKLFGSAENDYGNDLIIDSSGDLILTGEAGDDLGSEKNSGYRDILLIKFLLTP